MMRRATTLKFYDNLTEGAYRATDFPTFLAHIKTGYQSLLARVTEKSGRKQALASLTEAMAAYEHDVRRRRILELCGWPVFDKVPLPREENRPAEFLWLFTLPFVVTVSPEALAKSWLLPPGGIDASSFLGMLEEADMLADAADVRTFDTLLQREDLHRYGAREMARVFFQAELEQSGELAPSVLTLNPKVECHRTVTLHLPCALRLPQTVHTLLKNRENWPAALAAAELKKQLVNAGLAVDSVQALPPMSCAEGLFTCTASGAVELEANLREAVHCYGPLDIALKLVAPGYAEITGFAEDGTQYLIIPSLTYFEPPKALQSLLQRICVDLGLGFKGTLRPDIPSTGRLQ